MTAPLGRGSRYRDVPGTTAADGGAAALRPLPAVTGSVRHVVTAGERLDQLATAYYGQPLLWWRICDANPAFLSPLALVGADPEVTTLVPLRPTQPPPWQRLVADVSALPGVRAVEVVDDVVLVPQRRDVGGGGTVTLAVESPVQALKVTHNRAEVTVNAVVAAVVALVPVGPVEELTRVGEEIVVPSQESGTEGP